ncbi:EscC/YscC/HrcC family type III secretion system outer membrane ring protein [Gammaproteobacteria bacterium 45_16_T64]|nr:EscC/YscC/HrcC family type III secretion system outer membrane ring protein [Gammaproteobacteria bacterium 45_16_T64]
MKFSFRTWLLYTFIGVSVLSASTAHAQGWRWAKESYAHYAENEPVKDLLQQFGSSINIPVVVSSEVKGVVSGNFEESPAREFIDRLARIQSLLWYYDGQVLYVYDAGEIETAIIDVKPISSIRLMSTLKKLNVLDQRFDLNIVDEEGIVMVSGPPRYAQLVREISTILLSSNADVANDAFEIKVFELRYAWADDREMFINGKRIHTQGVASTLQSILGRSVRGGTVSGIATSDTVGKLKGQGLINRTPINERYPAQSQGGKRQDQLAGRRVEAHITANERLNAVIVHDRGSRMGLYEELIKSLDKPMSQVEIEVSIIDISTDRLDEMGLEWQARGQDGSFSTADFSNGVLPRETNELSLVLGGNANFSTILSSSQDFFLTRIRMLSQEGDAKVLSQPSVLTLDNNEAILDHSTTFYVRLAGEREVDLFPVSVGSVLRVTPHIIEEDNNRKVYMDINIEDGQQTGATVDNIPSIIKSVISTQALIDENSSLLVGGYYYNEDSSSDSKVPVLGDIPVLGSLFRTSGNQTRKSARLFLITPRIVTSDASRNQSDKLESMVQRQKSQVNETLGLVESDWDYSPAEQSVDSDEDTCD